MRKLKKYIFEETLKSRNPFCTVDDLKLYAKSFNKIFMGLSTKEKEQCAIDLVDKFNLWLGIDEVEDFLKKYEYSDDFIKLYVPMYIIKSENVYFESAKNKFENLITHLINSKNNNLFYDQINKKVPKILTQKNILSCGKDLNESYFKLSDQNKTKIIEYLKTKKFDYSELKYLEKSGLNPNILTQLVNDLNNMKLTNDQTLQNNLFKEKITKNKQKWVEPEYTGW